MPGAFRNHTGPVTQGTHRLRTRLSEVTTFKHLINMKLLLLDPEWMDSGVPKKNTAPDIVRERFNETLEELGLDKSTITAKVTQLDGYLSAESRRKTEAELFGVFKSILTHMVNEKELTVREVLR